MFCTKDSDDCYMINTPAYQTTRLMLMLMLMLRLYDRCPSRISSVAYQTTIRRLASFRLKVSQLSLHISYISSIKVDVFNDTEDIAIKLFANDTEDTFPSDNFYQFVSYGRSSCSYDAPTLVCRQLFEICTPSTA